MKIGFVPYFVERTGGSFQYSMTLLENLLEVTAGMDGVEVVIFARPQDRELLPSEIFNYRNCKIVPLRPNLRERLRDIAAASPLAHRLIGIVRRARARLSWNEMAASDQPPVDRPEYRDWFAAHGVDWVIYGIQIQLAFEAGFPYVMPVHDLQHRLQPEFPELTSGGEFAKREYLYRNAIGRALIILVDSQVGKEDLLNLYAQEGITEDRVLVLPFLASQSVTRGARSETIGRIGTIYDLPERYFFYPAQFWPHKNHLRIIEALALLKRQGRSDINIVFSGSAGADVLKNLDAVQALVRYLGLENQVRFLGFVPGEHIAALYAKAVALVMPTFFGPTNIPIIEAWVAGCPVLTSDIRGVREQVGDAGLLADPRSPDAIAGQMLKLWDDEDLRARLAALGREKVREYGPADFRALLRDIILRADDLARLRAKAE